MENRVKTVYLSGPIMDEHEGAARSWRDAAKLLLGRQFRLLDPMRRAFVDRKVDSANEIVEFDLLPFGVGGLLYEYHDGQEHCDQEHETLHGIKVFSWLFYYETETYDPGLHSHVLLEER